MEKFSFAGQKRALGKSTRRALRLSRLAILAERLARSLWPAFTILCFAMAIALFGGFAVLDVDEHRVAVLVLIALLALSLVWGGARFRMPDRSAAARRLDGSDPSHPLATLDDRLAAGHQDELTLRVWSEHLRRAERAAARLRAVAPDLRLARYDRWALRLFAPVTVIAGLLGAGDAWMDRLATLFAPEPRTTQAAGPVATRPPVAEAWAVPPSYTGLETVYLNKLAKLGQEISLPQGSELILRVTDLGGLPALTAGTLKGFEGFTDYGGTLAEGRGVLEESGAIQISGGDQVLADWKVTVIPDRPPQITMTEDPRATIGGALEVNFKALDDYGIDTAWAEIVPVGGLKPDQSLVKEPITFALPLPITGRALEVEDAAVHDLGAHPWTGAWVEMTLYAQDGAGQRTAAGPFTLRLPGRNFSNELARALVEQRRELAMDFEQGARALDVLQSVTRRPEEVFGEHHGAYLGVRTAIRRLASGVIADAVSTQAADVAEYLWLAALSLEDGDLSNALERLRSAEEALRRALESGTDEDIRRAMDELRAAMQEYIQEMIRQALERGLEPNDNSGQEGGQQMSQRDLEEMLDELQRRAESGLRDQARDMLSELSRMLQNMQPGRAQHGGNGQRSLEALQEMIQQQRDLADRTFDELRRQRRDGQLGPQGQQGRQGEGQSGEQGQARQGEGQSGSRQGRDGLSPGEDGRRPGDLAAEQEALRRALDELSRQLQGMGGDEINRALDDAMQSMGKARNDLQADSPGDAVEDQMDALDRLNDGAQALAEALTNSQGNTANQGRGRQEGRADDLRADPFDRPAGAFGAVDGRDTDVPDQSVLDRARRVLEELRRRSSESSRPRLELDYLQRLLDQF